MSARLHSLGQKSAHLMHRGVGLAADGYLRARNALGHVDAGIRIAGAVAYGLRGNMSPGQQHAMLAGMQQYTHHRRAIQEMDRGVLHQIANIGDVYDHARAAARQLGVA